MHIGSRLGFIGAGNMAEALIRGLLRTGAALPPDILASEPRAERARQLAAEYGISTGTTLEVTRASEVLILAVKPQIMNEVLDEIAPAVRPDQLLISVAAGVPLAALERRLPEGARVVRAMPNTPALVSAGATALAAGTHATAQNVEQAERIFQAVGITVALAESQLDAVTGLSGSGPAYVFLVIEALADGGVKAGLSRPNAQALAAQTVLGAARLLIDTGDHPGVLKDRVASPGGTTIAGLHALESGRLRAALIDAVEASARRSRELGEEFARKAD